MMKYFLFIIGFMVVGCALNPQISLSQKKNGEEMKSDSVSSVVESASSNSLSEEMVMEGFEETEFSTVFSEEDLEIRAREIAYQHGHTIFAMVMNLYKSDEIYFTDTNFFYPDAGEYELLHLEDGTRILKITSEWANMGASSYQEDFFLIDSIIVPLNVISGYCGGDHYNFDSDSNCISPYSDGYGYNYRLYRRAGERYLTVHKEGYYLEGEDPCKNGFDTIFVLQKSVVDQDSLVLFYSEEKRGGITKVLKSISKQSAETKLASFRK